VTVGQPDVSVAVSNPRRREEHRRSSSKRNTSQELDEDEEGSQEAPVTKEHKTASTNQVEQVEQEEEQVDEVERLHYGNSNRPRTVQRIYSRYIEQTALRI
jgi:hypothetical protein